MNNSQNNSQNKNSYKINVIKHIEDEKINKNNENNILLHSFLKSKSINNINNMKNILGNSFREKKSSQNSSNDQRNNSLFRQSKKSLNLHKGSNKCKIFKKEPISSIRKYWNNKNNNNYKVNLIKLTNQLYEYEEHLKKRIVSPKNDSKMSISKNSNTENTYLNDKDKDKKRIYTKHYSTKSFNYLSKNDEKKQIKPLSKFNPINLNNSKKKEIQSDNSNIKTSKNIKEIINRIKDLKKNKKVKSSLKSLNTLDVSKKVDINKGSGERINDIQIHKNKKIGNKTNFINIKKCFLFCCLNSK